MKEEAIQAEIVRYFTNNYCLKHHRPRSLIFSVPNEGKSQLFRAGMKPGASDLIVIHNGNPHFVEVKKPGGKQSAKQKQFEEHAKECGVPYHLVYSLEDFKKALNC